MNYEKDLDSVLQEITAQWGVPGMAVGMVEGKKIVHTWVGGVQSLATQAPVTPGSIFCVQSIGKCFVATAVAQLAERGKVDLDAPVVQYLPYFQMDDERYRQITIRQMLSHTSGMPDMDEGEYDELVAQPEWDEGAAERYVRSLSSKKLAAEPGEGFHYSNIAYNVLGDLIAKVSGQSFEAHMREHILIPAGMPDSTFLLADVPFERVAAPHLRIPEMSVNPIYPYHRADAPASFLHTTVVDLCHWGITCLNRGNYLGQSILSPASYDLMWTAVAERSSRRPSLYEEMGLGWTLGHFKGMKTVSHGGGGFGWTAFFLILPEKNCAAVILCNEESNAHIRAVQAVADTLIGEKPRANTVSWMVPISQALSEGGIQAAYACYDELKASEAGEYFFNEEELITLMLGLVSTKKLDLAIEVLGLNIYVYPEHVDSYVERAKLHLKKGEAALGEEDLRRVLAIEPEHALAARLLRGAPLKQ